MRQFLNGPLWDLTPEKQAPCELYDAAGVKVEGLIQKADSRTGMVSFFKVDESGDPILSGDQGYETFTVVRPAPLIAIRDYWDREEAIRNLTLLYPEIMLPVRDQFIEAGVIGS